MGKNLEKVIAMKHDLSDVITRKLLEENYADSESYRTTYEKFGSFDARDTEEVVFNVSNKRQEIYHDGNSESDENSRHAIYVSPNREQHDPKALKRLEITNLSRQKHDIDNSVSSDESSQSVDFTYTLEKPLDRDESYISDRTYSGNLNDSFSSGYSSEIFRNADGNQGKTEELKMSPASSKAGDWLHTILEENLPKTALSMLSQYSASREKESNNSLTTLPMRTKNTFPLKKIRKKILCTDDLCKTDVSNTSPSAGKLNNKDWLQTTLEENLSETALSVMSKFSIPSMEKTQNSPLTNHVCKQSEYSTPLMKNIDIANRRDTSAINYMQFDDSIPITQNRISDTLQLSALNTCTLSSVNEEIYKVVDVAIQKLRGNLNIAPQTNILLKEAISENESTLSLINEEIHKKVVDVTIQKPVRGNLNIANSMLIAPQTNILLKEAVSENESMLSSINEEIHKKMVDVAIQKPVPGNLNITNSMRIAPKANILLKEARSENESKLSKLRLSEIEQFCEKKTKDTNTNNDTARGTLRRANENMPIFQSYFSDRTKKSEITESSTLRPNLDTGSVDSLSSWLKDLNPATCNSNIIDFFSSEETVKEADIPIQKLIPGKLNITNQMRKTLDMNNLVKQDLMKVLSEI